MSSIVWTLELIELIKEQQSLGRSCAQIAAMVPGATRSSIIGKLHRLGIKGKVGQKTGTSFPRKSAPKDRVVQVREPYVPPPVVTLEEQRLNARPYSDVPDKGCYWPLYYEGDVQMYCAAPAEPRKSYCKCHLVMSAPPKNSLRGEYVRRKPSAFRYRG